MPNMRERRVFRFRCGALLRVATPNFLSNASNEIVLPARISFVLFR
jgi:hypothetical protein